MRNFLKTAALVATVLTGLSLTPAKADLNSFLDSLKALTPNNGTPTETSLGTCDSEWTKEQLRKVVPRDQYGNNTIIYEVTEIGQWDNNDGKLSCYGRAYTSIGQQLIVYQVMWTDPAHKNWYIDVKLIPLN